MRLEKRVARTIGALFLATGLAGCVKYEPKPLATAEVERAIAPPEESAIRESAASLKHPILPPMQIDPSRGLSPREAGVMAVIVNPDLRAERAQRAVAAAQLLQAGLLPNPQLTGNLDFPQGADHADSFTAYGLGANWDVTSLITLDAKKQAAAAESASIEMDIAWKEWQTAQAATIAAYDVLALQAQLKAATEVADEFDQNLTVVRRAVDQNNKTLLDLSAVEASAEDAKTVVIGAQKDLRHQRLLLNRALGLPPSTVVQLRDEPLPGELHPPAMDQLLASLESRRLDLLALKKGYESEESNLRIAVLGQFPKINLGFSGARDTSNIKTVGLAVGIDIPIFDQNQGAIAAEKATRQKLFDEYASRIFAARADIAEAVDNVVAANAEIAAGREALPALQRLVDTYRSALEKGNVDVLSFYTAQTALAQKKIEVLKLQQELIENWIALEIAAGQILPHEPGGGATTQETK